MSENTGCGCGCSDTSQAPTTTSQAATVPGAQQTEVKITGMTCSHCVASVTEELAEIETVSNIEIQLEPSGVSTAVITSGSALDAATIRAAIDEAGYAVEAINS